MYGCLARFVQGITQLCYHLLSTHAHSSSRHSLVIHGPTLIFSSILPLFPQPLVVPSAPSPPTGNPQLRPTRRRHSIGAPPVYEHSSALSRPPPKCSSTDGSNNRSTVFPPDGLCSPHHLHLIGTTHRPSVAESVKALDSVSASTAPVRPKDLG
jgi:hypothetical protein